MLSQHKTNDGKRQFTVYTQTSKEMKKKIERKIHCISITWAHYYYLFNIQPNARRHEVAAAFLLYIKIPGAPLSVCVRSTDAHKSMSQSQSRFSALGRHFSSPLLCAEERRVKVKGLETCANALIIICIFRFFPFSFFFLLFCFILVPELIISFFSGECGCAHTHVHVSRTIYLDSSAFRGISYLCLLAARNWLSFYYTISSLMIPFTWNFVVVSCALFSLLPHARSLLSSNYLPTVRAAHHHKCRQIRIEYRATQCEAFITRKTVVATIYRRPENGRETEQITDQ